MLNACTSSCPLLFVIVFYQPLVQNRIFLELEKLCVWRLADLALLFDTIRSCKRLVHLSYPPLDSAAWKHLSALDTLITIHIDGTYRSLDRNNLKFTPFLDVTALSFDLDTVTGIITLLQHSDFPSLKMFELKVSTTGCFWGRLSSCLVRCHNATYAGVLNTLTFPSHASGPKFERTLH
jgi:hypothetical protein